MGPKFLTDVATMRPTRPNLEIPLDHVGMDNISTRILLNDGQGHAQSTFARVNAAVSLDKSSARGIHMSRLYKIVNELDSEIMSDMVLKQTLEKMLMTHQDLSRKAFLQIDFDYLVKRKALKSSTEGWRSYPISLRAQSVDGEVKFRTELRVQYSSTCPCSASLAREAIQQKFAQDFLNRPFNVDDVHNWLGQESSFAAVPHSQRSEAKIQLEFTRGKSITQFVEWIDIAEQALGTPVQAAVKREDEQEFARLNGQNLMFCEDAARKIKAALLTRPELSDFEIEVRHFESLHAHDVVARCSKTT